MSKPTFNKEGIRWTREQFESNKQKYYKQRIGWIAECLTTGFATKDQEEMWGQVIEVIGGGVKISFQDEADIKLLKTKFILTPIKK